MKDDDFWKRNYQSMWADSSEKEKAFRDLVKENTGLELVPNGLGAESTEMIHGSAQKSGMEKGSPDYMVKGTNIYVEVTGPLNEKTDPKTGLWLRPDKMKHAYMHRKEQEEWFALYFPLTKEWLCIEANEAFFEDYREKRNVKDYFEKTPKIRGVQERYYSIRYRNPFVHDINYLFDRLRALNEPA